MTRGNPLVGIVCGFEKNPSERYYCDRRYPDAVSAAGGIPLLVPYGLDKGALGGFQGLIFIGGPDVDPSHYGEKIRSGTSATAPERFFFEKTAYRFARKKKLPVFGICYGMQLINVLEGGTLYQDIARDVKSSLCHRNKKTPLNHVRLDSASRLARVLSSEAVQAYCSHHQAVKRPGKGLKAAAWANDGVVEAIESDDARLLAVQWHPERTPEADSTKRLFRHFISLCRTRA